jgi:DGQHR domain-containing protein
VQRSIDSKRVAVMVSYLKSALESGTIADWGPIELVTSSQPDMSEFESRHIVLMDSDADYFIADGQHRYCAILDFCRENPQYCDRFTQPITISIIPHDKLNEWAGQAFHDRNYFAVAVRAGKALSVDSRDPVNTVAKAIADHPAIVMAGGIAYERDTLLKGDSRFTTHSVLHRFVRGFLFGRPGLDKGVDTRVEVSDLEIASLDNYLSILGDIMPWNVEERDSYLSRASVVLSALAVVGHDLMVQHLPESELRNRLRVLGNLDWRRSNLGWVGIVGSEKAGEVQPASSRPAIDATIRFLRERLGVIRPMNGDGE